jgi:hypothetical protein
MLSGWMWSFRKAGHNNKGSGCGAEADSIGPVSAHGIIRNMSLRFARYLIGFAISAMTMFAADLTGIWAGQAPSRRGDKEDVAFQFKVVNGNTVTGKMFGDEFDLPLEEASVSGNQVTFTITTTNYYSRSQVKFVYTGTIKGNEIELTRARVGGAPAAEGPPATRQNLKQTFTIKRLT